MKIVYLAFAFCFFNMACLAQATLQFCDQVKNEDTCRNQASEFTITKDGGTIAFLLKNANGLGTEKISYKISKLEENGAENFITSIEQTAETKWTFAWQEAVFFEAGTYKIKVYNLQSGAEPELICSNILRLFMK